MANFGKAGISLLFKPAARMVVQRETGYLQFSAVPIMMRVSHISRSIAMAYKISDACVNCGACEGECPVGAISEANGARVIDADACISCGACAGVCPTEAISEE